MLDIYRDIGGPLRRGYQGAMDYQSWEREATPDYILNGEDVLQDQYDQTSANATFMDVLAGITSWIPIVGNLMAFADNIANRSVQSSINDMNRFEARRADWYNSPDQQLRRLKKAGLNPFMQSYVKSYGSSVPSYGAYLPSPHNPESVSSLLNALTNYSLSQHRIENLDSLTDINEYKTDFLLPQLYDRNGYVNNILELQSAWETNNYDKERQIKQNLLNISYEQAVLELGQGIMEIMPLIPGGYTNINPNTGCITVEITDDQGVVSTYNLDQLPADQLPLYLQEKFYEVWKTKELTKSQITLNKIQGSTISLQGMLYNSRREELDLEILDFKKSGYWRSDDPVLRAFSGASADPMAVWKRFGLGLADDFGRTLNDIGSAYLSKGKSLNSVPSQPVLTSPNPKPLNIPRGAKPYTFNGQTYWYYPK